MKRIVALTLGIILALVVAAPMAVGQTTKERNDTGDLVGAWWQWAVQKDYKLSPLFGEYSGGVRCAGGSERGAWFLAGSGDGSDVTRDCKVPAGTDLFFPVVNVVCVEEWDGETEAQLRKCANDIVDAWTAGSSPYAKVDYGSDGVDVKDVSYKRAESPLFTLTMPKNNIFYHLDPSLDFLSGPSDAVADGLWVKLPPLPKGKHKVEFGGEFTGFEQNNTYNLTVE